MWFSGLRGAMAYALALNSVLTFGDEGKIMLTITLFFIAINVLYI